MVDGTERQAVLPAAAEICDLNILQQKKKKKAQNEAAAEQFSLQAVEGSSSDLIALGPTLAPEEQRVPP